MLKKYVCFFPTETDSDALGIYNNLNQIELKLPGTCQWILIIINIFLLASMAPCLQNLLIPFSQHCSKEGTIIMPNFLIRVVCSYEAKCQIFELNLSWLILKQMALNHVGIGNFYCKGSNSKSLHISWPDGLCQKYSAIVVRK